jgi:hypothetical protein
MDPFPPTDVASVLYSLPAPFDGIVEVCREWGGFTVLFFNFEVYVKKQDID